MRDGDSRDPIGEAHFVAAARSDGKRAQEAAIEYEACLALAPDSAPALFNYGGVLRRLGRMKATIEQLQAARRLAPGDADVCVELGLAYRADGVNAKAIEEFKRAIVLNPESPESRLHLPGLIEELERSGREGRR